MGIQCVVKMPIPSYTEHKTVQARILAYTLEIGWKYVPCAEAEKPGGIDVERETCEWGMRHPLMTAQTRVHDLDVDEFCSNLLQKLVVLCDITGRAPDLDLEAILAQAVPEFGNKLWPNSPKVFGAFERL